MIYAPSRTSQNRLTARVSTKRRQRNVFSLAQRHHIVILVDSSTVAVLTVLRTIFRLVRRWCADLQDTTTPQGRDLNKNHAGPAGFMDDVKEELIAFVTDWRDCGMHVTRFALVRKIGSS